MNQNKPNTSHTPYEINFTIENIRKAAEYFIENIGDNNIILFEGEMGAGKTTFIAEVCRCLGVSDDIGSPTFSLINEYEEANGKPIFHFDLYRIETPQEAFDIGITDYFESGNLCFVEWPDRLGPLTPNDARKAILSINSDNSRKLTF